MIFFLQRLQNLKKSFFFFFFEGGGGRRGGWLWGNSKTDEQAPTNLPLQRFRSSGHSNA